MNTRPLAFVVFLGSSSIFCASFSPMTVQIPWKYILDEHAIRPQSLHRGEPSVIATKFLWPTAGKIYATKRLAPSSAAGRMSAPCGKQSLPEVKHVFNFGCTAIISFVLTAVNRSPARQCSCQLSISPISRLFVTGVVC